MKTKKYHYVGPCYETLAPFSLVSRGEQPVLHNTNPPVLLYLTYFETLNRRRILLQQPCSLVTAPPSKFADTIKNTWLLFPRKFLPFFLSFHLNGLKIRNKYVDCSHFSQEKRGRPLWAYGTHKSASQGFLHFLYFDFKVFWREDDVRRLTAK